MPICFKGLPCQFICSDYEHTFKLRVGNINNTKKSTAPCLSNSDSRVLLARAILAWLLEYILDFIFPHFMLVDMRKPGFFINIKANFH
jgi:hypothetical protein